MKWQSLIAFHHAPGFGIKDVIRRGATSDGSRAFQRPVRQSKLCPCRGATAEPWPCATPIIRRRSATQRIMIHDARGLKPTATIRRSLRDESQADLNQEATELAKKIQKNFEGLGI